MILNLAVMFVASIVLFEVECYFVDLPRECKRQLLANASPAGLLSRIVLIGGLAAQYAARADHRLELGNLWIGSALGFLLGRDAPTTTILPLRFSELQVRDFQLENAGDGDLSPDGTNLLLLNSVNTWDVATYALGGAFVSNVPIDRNSPFGFQMEGIDGDGQSLFMSTAQVHQPIVTNSAAGVFVSQFNTNMEPLVSYIGGLAYNRNNDTLWVAGASEFRRFSRSGALLAAVNTGAGNTNVTGLEVIGSTVPEASSLALCSVGVLSGAAIRFYRLRRRSEIGMATKRIDQWNRGHVGGNVGNTNPTRLQYDINHIHRTNVSCTTT